MAPIVDNDPVINSVLAPNLADAVAASQPAWPPPITITSKLFIVLFYDYKLF